MTQLLILTKTQNFPSLKERMTGYVNNDLGNPEKLNPDEVGHLSRLEMREIIRNALSRGGKVLFCYVY